MPENKVTKNRNVQLAVLFIVILVIGGFAYADAKADVKAMRQELKNVNEEVSSIKAELEENKKELKKQQNNHEDESPPLKKKKQPTRKEFKEKLKKLVAKTGKTVTAKLAKLASGSSVTQKETETSKVATPTAVSASESTDTSATATPATSVPGPTATTTPGPTAVLKETATPGPTSEPVATSTATPTQEPVATSTATPTQEPIVTEKPITADVINDNAVIYKDDNETEVLAKPKKGEKLTNVTEHEYGTLKVTYKGEEGFVDYKDTDYLERKKIFSPIHEVRVEDEAGIICEEGVELRTKPGCTSKSKVIAILEGGMRFIALSNVEMLEDEYKGYYEVLIPAIRKVGYVDGRKLDFDEIEIKVSAKEENSKSTKTSSGNGLKIKTIHPTKMYEKDTINSEVILELRSDEDLFDVQECTESNSGMLMVKCKRGNKVIKGYVEYLNTDYLDKINRYDSVYRKQLDNIKATVNANSVNLRSKPGITKKSIVVGVADKGLNLILQAYEEVVGNEKHGWFKAIVVETGQTVYIYGKFVDVEGKAMLKTKETENTATGSAITANEDDDQTKTENATTGSAITASKDGDDQSETEKTTSQEYKSESVPKDSEPIKRQTDIYFDRKMSIQRIMKMMQRKGRM